jgi:hypothetical protein
VNKLRHKKKISVTNKVKEEFREIESQDRKSLNLKGNGDIQASRKS